MTDLLTTREVQDLLQIDRTTIYRMVEGGQLPAIRVGKQWRFERAELERWLRTRAAAPATPTPAVPVHNVAAPTPPTGPLAELLPLECVQLVQDAFADALGVMIVITDMEGRPVTRVSNICGLYAVVIDNDEAVTRCIQNWQRLAGAVPLEPRFVPSNLGLLCARGLIRAGNELKGMVFMGGIAPETWPPASEEVRAIADHFGLEPDLIEAHLNEVHRLDKPARDRALSFVQRIADVVSHIVEDRNALYSRLQAIASLTSL